MSRDPDRIDRILPKIEEYWKNNPDLRLAQIISIINNDLEYGDDVFYLEDDELEEWIDKQID